MNKLTKYWVCALVRGPVTAKMLYLMLHELCGENGEIVIPQRKISNALGITKATVSRNLRCLRKQGLIEIYPQFHADDGGRAANKYRIKLRGV